MQPCCSHNIFQGLIQALPLVPLLLMSFGSKLKALFKKRAASTPTKPATQ